MAASLAVGGWRAELDGLLARFGRLFVRAEPREQAGRYLEGLLGPVERKNGWQLAEHLGDARPWRTQRVLSHVLWDEEAARDLCREHAVERLGAEDAVLVVDESGFVKKGRHSAGVARQYCGTVGKVETCQVGVFLAYGSRGGHALIDRRLYLPGGVGRRRGAPSRGQGARGRAVPDQARDRARDARPGAGRRRAVRVGAGRRGVRGRPAVAGDAGGARQALPPDRPQQRRAGGGARRRGRAARGGGPGARPAAPGLAAAERRRGHQGRAPLRLGAGAAAPPARSVPGALAASAA